MQENYRKLYISLLFGLCFLTASGQSHSLAYYLDAGQINSPLLKDYQNQAAIAQYRAQQVTAKYRTPEIFTEAHWMEAPVVNGFGYDDAYSNGSLYQAVGGVRMPLLTGDAMQAEKLQYKYEGDRASWLQKRTWHEIQKEITTQFIETYAAQKAWENAMKQLELLRDNERISEKLGQGSVIKGSDVLLLRIGVRDQEIAVGRLEAKYIMGIFSLDSLCGLTDTLPVYLEDPELTMNTHISDSSRALERFAIDSMVVKNEQAIFNIQYRPQLSAFANAGLASTTLNDIGHHFGISFGLDFSFDLNNGRQRRLMEEITDLKLESINNYRSHIQLQQSIQLAGLAQQISLASLQMDQLHEQIAAYENLLKIYRKELMNGEMSITAYLVVFQQYLQAQQELIDQQKEKYLNINAYNYWNW